MLRLLVPYAALRRWLRARLNDFLSRARASVTGKGRLLPLLDVIGQIQIDALGHHYCVAS